MIYLLYGKDDYRVWRAARDIRAGLGGADEGMLESNTTTLDGRTVTPDELLAHVMAVPFLAPARVVIVEGLLAALGAVKGGRRKKAAADDPLEPWRRTAATLGDAAAIPPTTTLILMEGDLEKNAAFPIFAPIARTIDHPPLSKNELPSWIAETAAQKGVKLSGRAVAALTQLIGPDLWTLSNEIDRLGAYVGAGTVEAETVTEVVTAAREAKVWDLTDGIVDGDATTALSAMRRLLEDGEAPPRLLYMVARQYRHLAIVKDMKDRRARDDEIARASGVPGSRVGAVGALAMRFPWATLRAGYRRILEADLNVKRGLQDDETALQALVLDLCALAPERGARPAAAANRR